MSRFAALRVVAVALAAALVAACAALPPDKASDAQARSAFAALQRGDWRALDPQLSPALARDPQLHDKLERVRDAVPMDAPARVTLIKTQRNDILGRGAKTSSLTYAYSFGTRLFVVNVVFDRSGGASTIAGLHILPVDPRLAAANRFDAPGKSAAQYAFLAACILSPLLMLVAAVAVVRTRDLEVRWIWLVLVLAGVGTLWMNWTTGAVTANWLAVNLAGAGATRALPPLTPWMLQMTLPLGAVVALVRIAILRRGRGGTA